MDADGADNAPEYSIETYTDADDGIEYLTLKNVPRDTLTKQAFFASMSDAQRDRLQAEAFRFLMRKMDESGDEYVAEYYELAMDLYDDEFNWKERPEPEASDGKECPEPEASDGKECSEPEESDE